MNLAGAIFTIGFVLQVISMNYAMFVVARFISGVAVGFYSVIVPIYISEISPPEIRGSLLALSELFGRLSRSLLEQCKGPLFIVAFTFGSLE